MIKCLSLRQPWADFVLFHGKRIENRRWNTAFRGHFLIHAAKGMTRSEYESAMGVLDDVNGIQAADVLPFESLKRGGIVGHAWLVHVVRPRPNMLLGGVETHYPHGVEWRWHMPEQFGFVLEGVRPLPFVQWTGELGFFEVPDDYVERAARGESGKKPRRVQP